MKQPKNHFKQPYKSKHPVSTGGKILGDEMPSSRHRVETQLERGGSPSQEMMQSMQQCTAPHRYQSTSTEHHVMTKIFCTFEYSEGANSNVPMCITELLFVMDFIGDNVKSLFVFSVPWFT